MRPLILALVLVACGEQTSEPVVDTGEVTATVAPQQQSGAELFALGCAGCHGSDGRGGTSGPDLRNVAADFTPEEVADVVRLGTPFMDPVPFDEAQALAVGEYVVQTVVGP